LKIKRFFAKDIRSALDEIKISLGPDAIIMSNKSVDGGVEIVAAIDEDNNAVLQKPAVSAVNTKAQPQIQSVPPAASNQTPLATPREIKDDQVSLSGFQQRLIQQQAQYQAVEPPVTTKVPLSARPSQRVAPGPSDENSQMPPWVNSVESNSYADITGVERRTGATTTAQDPLNVMAGAQANSDSQAIEQLRQEMAAMRQLLQHQVSGLMEQEVHRSDPIKSILLKGLHNVGFSPEVSEQLVLNVNPQLSLEQAVSAVANTMSRRVLTTNDDILAHGGVVALLGPTGVGKTTTVAKLAARSAMKYGSDQIAMITTDCYRIGAYEQLNTYGKILGCPVKVARDAQQLADAIYQCRDKRLVLIDTAGMGQRDVRLSEQLATLVNSSHVNIRSYLVLPATAQRKVLEEAVVQFRKMPLVGCIITKMDEAIGAGDVLSVAIAHSLPLAYLTNGQRVPEDIGAADPKSLINSVIEQLGQAENCMFDGPNTSQFSSFNG